MVPITDDLSHREKTLLAYLGREPDTPTRTLIEATGYHCQSTVSRKKKDLSKKGYLRGPYYHININTIGKNELFDVYVDIEFDVSDYDLVFKLIQAVRCWRWIFPTIQGDRFFVHFQCNYFPQVARLLSYLKKEGIIEYNFYSSQNRWIGANPDFFGKEILSYDNLLSQCELPDMTYPSYKVEKTWRWLDLKILAYLQVKSIDINSIQKFERDFYGNPLKREQIKYCIHKLVEYGIAERKHYNVSPYPRSKCFSSLLFLRAKHPSQTLTIMGNLGRNSRVYKAYTLAGEMGIMLFWISTQNMPGFLSAFENMDNVWVKAYQLKTHDTKYMIKQSFSVDNFDFENQRWMFPYQKYQEEIECILEGEKKERKKRERKI